MFKLKQELPRTVHHAVEILMTEVLDKDKLLILKAKTKDELIRHHHGLGQIIRNEFGLWDGRNKELLTFLAENHPEQNKSQTFNNFPFHPDDASQFIIESFWERLNEKV